MNSAIKELYNTFIEGSTLEKPIVDIICAGIPYKHWLELLYSVDSNIGGYGVHNIDKEENYSGSTAITGTYIERPVYRGLQYCSVDLLGKYINLEPRWLIKNACSHIEGLVNELFNLIFKQSQNQNPLGRKVSILLQNQEVRKSGLVAILCEAFKINKVLITVKHDYDSVADAFLMMDPLDIDSHIYTFDDSIVVYFSCRIFGVELSKKLHDLYGIPKSMDNIPVISRQMFNSIAQRLSYNLRHMENNIVNHGRKRTEPFILKRRKILSS
jgi:hypothetical protein